MKLHLYDNVRELLCEAYFPLKVFLLLCLTYNFLYFFYKIQSSNDESFSVCFIKNATGIPCPSCGSTRAVIAFFNGDLLQSIAINPFGIIVSLIMIVAPFWILIDWILKKNSFYLFYKKTEAKLKNPIIYIPLIVLVIANWIWNILKNN